jgi:pyruvate dehydrogenase E2 component (dihydrolipoamide acetyltransferase)
MVKTVIMPQLDATMNVGTIIKWLKKEGDCVGKGDPLLEVETDKVTIEVESLDSGILLKIIAQEGEEIPVTQPIAYIGDETDSISTGFTTDLVSSSKLVSSTEIQSRVPSGKENPDRVVASPLARKLAREGNVDINSVIGSGSDGKITKEDVLRFIESKEPMLTEVERGVEPSQISGSPRVAEVISLAGIRKTIAKRLAESFRDVPHFVVTVTVDMTNARNAKQDLNSVAKERHGVKLSYTDLIIKAVALALIENKILNSSLEGEEIKVYQDINIGLAVAFPAGLIVPTIFRADQLSLFEIAGKREELVKKSQKNSINLKEVAGGTFTISNLGMYGVDSFSAIINPPQSAILAVGAIAEKIIPFNGQIAIRPLMILSLSVDHRVIDGVQSAKFLNKIKDLLEHPSLL